MFPAIAIALGVAIAGILGFAATKPNEFRMQRTGRIKAAPEKIFPFIADFHNWPAWSPWEKLDPNMTRTLSGAASGPEHGQVDRQGFRARIGQSESGRRRVDARRVVGPENILAVRHSKS